MVSFDSLKSNSSDFFFYKGFPWHLSSAPVGAFHELGTGRWSKRCAKEMHVKSDFWRSRAEVNPYSSLNSSAAQERIKKQRWKYHPFYLSSVFGETKEAKRVTKYRLQSGILWWGNIGMRSTGSSLPMQQPRKNQNPRTEISTPFFPSNSPIETIKTQFSPYFA